MKALLPFAFIFLTACTASNEALNLKIWNDGAPHPEEEIVLLRYFPKPEHQNCPEVTIKSRRLEDNSWEFVLLGAKGKYIANDERLPHGIYNFYVADKTGPDA